MRYFILSLVLMCVVGVAAATYFWSPRYVIRITTGPTSGTMDRFVTVFIGVMKTKYPRVTFEPVAVPDLPSSSAALESGKTDLAIIRTDVSPPTNGQTIAILRRDAVLFILPAKSSIDAVPRLAGKSVGILQGPLQAENEKVLDTVLNYYNVPLKSVNRMILSPDDLAKAVHDNKVAAVLAVGKIGPGPVADAFALVSRARSAPASLLAFDDADTFSKSNPGFESLDIPKAALRARPEVPDDTLTTLAVTYRLVARDSMLNAVAGAIGQSIFTARGKLLASTPAAAGIEAPDPDDKNPILPVHPGVAAYLNDGENSFFEDFQNYFYTGGIILSLLASLGAMIMGLIRRGDSAAERKTLSYLIGIAEKARHAGPQELEELADDLHQTVTDIVQGKISEESFQTATLAASHARNVIDTRRGQLLAPGIART